VVSNYPSTPYVIDSNCMGSFERKLPERLYHINILCAFNRGLSASAAKNGIQIAKNTQCGIVPRYQLKSRRSDPRVDYVIELVGIPAKLNAYSGGKPNGIPG
jgi:hypothetical protein